MIISRLYTTRKTMFRNFCFLIGALVFAWAPVQAGTITTGGENAGVTVDVVGITGFVTTGADMTGMKVSAVFHDGNGFNLLLNCTWAANGPASGGCGSGSPVSAFEVSLLGDTYAYPFLISVAGTLSLLSIEFDGIPGNTVFDRAFAAGGGTLGSEDGNDADGSTGAGPASPAVAGVATYSNLVSIQGAAPVGDLFATLRIDFAGQGLRPGSDAVASFIADTDTVGPFAGGGAEVPEPATWGLVGAGLVLAGLRGRFTPRRPVA